MLYDEIEGGSSIDWSCCALYKATQFLYSAFDWDALIEEVLTMVLEVTGTQKVLLVLGDGGDVDFQTAGSRHMEAGESKEAVAFCRKAMASLDREGEAAAEGVIGREDRVIGRDEASDHLCLLLTVWKHPVGVLYLDHPTRACRFPDKSSAFYAALADQIAFIIENARRYSLLQRENVQLRQRVEGEQFSAILGDSPPMRRMKQMLEKVIPSPASVLIIGESGTGKELIARALHFEGPRRERGFVAENCAALPESLLESELFGHARGAYTGAAQEKQGLFETANGGTLFLDEIADTSPAVQAKLLRVLESGEIRRLGETETRQVEVRIVAATSRDLLEEVEAGRFRAELYYRLSVLTVNLPPLRERREDISLLTRHFLDDYAQRTGKKLPGFSAEVMTAMRRYRWPGNVRQLRNEVERMAALADEGMEIPFELLSDELRGIQAAPAVIQEDEALPQALERIKKAMIEKALEACEGNRTGAAENLGISRPNLQKTMKRLGVS